MRLFTAGEVARVTGGSLRAGDPEAPIAGVAIDSRRARPGDLFVALPGRREDGHRFVHDAFVRGATAALISRELDPDQRARLPAGFVLIQVEDPVAALGRLAAHHRRRFAAPAVAVTGSVGKTTTKEMIAAVLATRLRVLKSPGNYNNELGLPLAIFAWRPEHQVGVFELAMRGRGQIAALCAILSPQVGVVTNVGESHLELLGSIEAIAAAKGELVEALPPDGTAVLNADDPRVRAMADRTRARVVYYGTDPAADVRAEEVTPDGPFATRFRLVTPAGTVAVRLPMPGTHQVANALAAAAVALVLGLSPADVAAGLEAFQPVEGRLRVIPAGAVTVIDDSYNAAPSSTVAALRVLRQAAGTGRAIAVLGDMLELGACSEEGHRRVGAEAAARADLLFALGPQMRWAVEAARAAGMPAAAARHFDDREDLVRALLEELRPGDTVLVKGSRAMQLEAVVAEIEAAQAGEEPAGREEGRG